ncbi:MAG: B12-binding domain-containing radical SAM protein [Desulfobacterota bacterium]|nr:B12-binding domain-containing radical SAM protein [Thermodesulfobacteriota bacterium]MDW8002220.1 radical SAM protein [Deltaproteobacteria bacterium]
MKVLLINFFTEKSIHPWKIISRKWPPLDLLNASTLLSRHGIENLILDLNTERLSSGSLNRLIQRFDKIFVSSASIDRWTCPPPYTKEFMEFLKSLPAKEKIYALGPHITLMPEECLFETKIKGVVMGQPELGILEACLKNRDGIVSSDTFDLDILSPPAYEKVKIEKYFYPLLGSRFALLETSRGCYFQCKFCFKLMYGNRILRKSLPKVMEEIDYVVRKIGARNVYFIDSEFVLDRLYVEEMCKAIIREKLNFQWCCQTRVDSLDEPILHLMQRAGCRLIHFGLESGSETTLTSMGKRIDLEEAKNIIQKANRLGIKTAGFFILGYPGESERDLEATVSFALKLPLDYASFHIYIPYPDVLYGTAQKEGKNAPFFTAKMAFFKFYLRPSYLLRRTLRSFPTLGELKLFWDFIR